MKITVFSKAVGNIYYTHSEEGSAKDSSESAADQALGTTY